MNRATRGQRGKMMTRTGHFRSLAIALGIAAAAAMTLAACGRKGPLERPESAKTSTQNYDPADDATVRGPRKPFILDRLLR